MIRQIQGGRKTNRPRKDSTKAPAAKPLTIPCRCCIGKGRPAGIEPLPADYLPTFEALRKFAYGATGEMLNLKINAVARATQLARLERWGFVRRIGKEGKAIIWEAV